MACPEDFCDVFEALQRAGAPYVVIGGVAVVLHGYHRSVPDLDIVVSSNAHEANVTMQALFMRGFVPSVPLPLSMVTVLRMFDPSSREVDVVVRALVPFDQLWPDSIEIPVGNTVARVASLSNLIRWKQMRSRPDDLEDIERLGRITQASG